MNYMHIDKASISNGLGVRVVLWCAGCSLHCDGCQNPSTWAFGNGKPFDANAKTKLLEMLDKPYIKGVTFSGGNPLDSFAETFALCKEIKEQFPEKDIWLYSGYTFEEINQKTMSIILPYIDVLVDGPYIKEQRDITLAFRGSRNQRLIDVKETIKQNKIVTLPND